MNKKSKNDKMIGYCGYNCYLCAARSNDRALREKMVAGWKKLYGHDMYDPDNVKCDGCLSDGDVADKQCRARPCAKARGVKSCAHCPDFPCDKLRPLIPVIFFVTEDEYNLCMRQFDSRGNLAQRLADVGKPPFWKKSGDGA